LLAKWGIQIKHQENWGRYLIASKRIPKGETVVSLPPFAINTFASLVGNEHNEGISFINALRVAGNTKDNYLFTIGISTETFENFLNHSCSACLEGQVRKHHVLDFVAKRDIEPGTSLTFDYDEFELDLVEQARIPSPLLLPLAFLVMRLSWIWWSRHVTPPPCLSVPLFLSLPVSLCLCLCVSVELP
jgi:hypothetical protein